MAMSFEEYLVSRDLISAAIAIRSTGFAKKPAVDPFGSAQVLVAASHALVRAISDFHGVPMVEDDQWLKHPASNTRLSSAFLRENKVFPIGEGDDGILLAMEDPSDAYAINAVRLALSVRSSLASLLPRTYKRPSSARPATATSRASGRTRRPRRPATTSSTCATWRWAPPSSASSIR